MYAIEKEGAIKYILRDGERITKGHQSFFVNDEGYTVGKLGTYNEIIISPNGDVVPHIGSDGFAENNRIQECILIEYLNHGTNKKNMVER